MRSQEPRPAGDNAGAHQRVSLDQRRPRAASASPARSPAAAPPTRQFADLVQHRIDRRAIGRLHRHLELNAPSVFDAHQRDPDHGHARFWISGIAPAISTRAEANTVREAAVGYSRVRDRETRL